MSTKASQSATQIALSYKQDKAGSFTSSVTSALFQTIASSNAALALKRDTSDSVKTAEIQGLVSAARPIASITNLQAEIESKASQSATTIALSNKVANKARYRRVKA